MIICLSGPQHAFKKAQGVLTAAGFKIVVNDQGDPVPDDYGLGSGETRWTGSVWSQGDIDAMAADNPDHGLNVGDIIRGTGQIVSVDATSPMCFLTVDGDDPDKANQAVSELSWRLRAHWDKQEEPKKESLEQRLARVGIGVDELKKLMGS